MSLSERRPSDAWVPSPRDGGRDREGGPLNSAARATRRGVLLALALSPLAACGFQPIYGENAPARALIGATRLETPKGRIGFFLRDALRDRYGDTRAGEVYVLEASLTLSKVGLAITEDDSITRFTVRGLSDFRLTRAEDKSVVMEGRVEALTAYSATGSLFATRAAERDADRRIAKDIGERIALRLAALTNRGG